MKEPLGEHDIIPLVIDLILRPLLSSGERRLRWPEINTDERTCRTKRVQRPDSVLNDIDSLAFGCSRLFGEVKPDAATDRLNAIDLLRLSRFAKDAIDFSRAKQIITFQAVGPLITFYLSTLIGDGTYTMAELHTIELPACIKEISKIIENINRFYDIYLRLETMTLIDSDFWEHNHRETNDTPFMDKIMDKSQRKRFCMVHFN
ncbi:hypothetical protein INT45_009980 [Circinella minor]|uniref:Uncharacterized protein n=1 Tax=Circinella minor TaxID=1195481 RepID=A0A8H7S8L6_9FUNG|nr:hypothetical protein INT45_009980 [Circinella minor]